MDPDEKDFVSPDQLDEDLITLANLPTSRYWNLFLVITLIPKLAGQDHNCFFENRHKVVGSYFI